MALSIAVLRQRLAGAQVSTEGMSDEQVVQTYNSIAQPKDKVNPQTLEPAGGATGGGFTSPDYEFVNPAVIGAQIQAAIAAAQQAYNQKRMDLIDLPGLQIDKDRLAMDAAKAASEQALSAAGLIAQLRGPRNAFVQQAVMHGLNEAGVSRSLDAIAGKYTMPSFQAPQATPEPATLQTLADDLRAAGGTNAQAGSPLDDLAAQYRNAARQGNDFMPPGTSTVTEDAGSIYDRFMSMDAAFRQQTGRRMTEQEWAAHAQTLGLPGAVAQGLARKVYAFFEATGGRRGPGRQEFMGLAQSLGIGYGQTPTTTQPGATQPGATQPGATAPATTPATTGQNLGYPVVGWTPGSTAPTMQNEQAGPVFPGFTAPGNRTAPVAIGARPPQATADDPLMRAMRAPTGTAQDLWQRYVDAFPNPNKIVGKQWLRGSDDDRQFWTGLGEAKGWSESDILTAVKRGLPQFRAPRQGLVA